MTKWIVRNLVAAFSPVCLLMVSLSCSASDMDELLASVVYLVDEVPILETVDGKDYEVWLRPTKGGSERQKTVTRFGSAFLVSGKKTCYLVSAKHVAKHMSPNASVVLRGASQLPLTNRLADFLNVSTNLWMLHAVADVAVHPLKTSEKLKFTLPIPLTLLRQSSNTPPRERRLSVVGFPLGFGAQDAFAPITRDSNPASDLRHDAEGDYFLIQDPIAQGFSGGPVCFVGDLRVVAVGPSSVGTAIGGTLCHGVAVATYPDGTGGKFGRVQHIGYVVEMIDSIESQLGALPDLKFFGADSK